MEKLNETKSTVKDKLSTTNDTSEVAPTKSLGSDKNYYTSSQTLVSNFYTFNFDKTQNVFLYSISTHHKTQENLNTHYGLIKKLMRLRHIKDFIRGFFPEFYVSGNCMFAENIKNVDTLSFKVSWMKNEILLLKEGEEEPETSEIYTITFSKKFPLADYNSTTVSKNEKEHVKRFMNIILQNGLEKLGYIRTEPGVKAIYYKKGIATENSLQISDNVFYVHGFRVNTNFYEGNQILVKTVQKFRMIRSDTYLNYYNHLKSKITNTESLNSYFTTFMKNRLGLAKHTERRVKVTNVNYDVDVTQFMFKLKTKKGEEPKMTSMADYYLSKYNYKIVHPVQPLAEQVEVKRGFNGKKISQTTHFPIELLYILGKLEEDKFDVAKAAIVPPQAKFEKTHILMKELKSLFNEQSILDKKAEENKRRGNPVVKKTHINFNLKVIKSGILQAPDIELGEGKIIKPSLETGVFDIKNSAPLENQQLKSWIIFVYDAFEDEVNQIANCFNEAKKALGLNFEEPIVHVIDSRKCDREVFEDYIKSYITEYRDHCSKNNKPVPEVAMLIISRRKEGIYTYFKNALNSLSGFTIRSQVVKKESILKKGLTVAGNILLQIWAKRDLPLWRSKNLKKICKNTMIAGYSVAASGKRKCSITSLCATVSSDYVSFINYCRFHENTNKLTPKLGEILDNAVEYYEKINGKKPSKILLYREGSNERQREKIVKLEIMESVKKVQRLKDIPITLIFVNKQCDIRFFRDEKEMDKMNQTNVDMTCLEKTQLSMNENFIYTNAKPGSVIESGVTLFGNNEFYVISSYSQRGTCNPTHYYVELDEAQFDKQTLYKVTYDLTYLYFNNQKCIRTPVPLHNAMRMSAMASKHLSDSYMGKANYNFGY